MTKKEKTPKVLKEVVQETESVKGDRESRWASFLENAKVSNPVKFALKEANGEFESIPESFK